MLPKNFHSRYWNEELDALKNDSVTAHDFWNLNGRPRTGPIFDAKKNAYYRYKLHIRKCRTEHDQNKVDDLNENLMQGDTRKFWRSFKYFNSVNNTQTPHIDGLSNDVDIANRFARNYKAVYESNDATQAKVLSDELSHVYKEYCCQHANDSVLPFLLSWSEMLSVMSKLQAGKATATFIKPEHILYGSPKLAWHLHLLFNAMIMHSYVPHDFLKGVISPLIKDSCGNHNDPNNYRPLTLSSIFSNLFEHALLLKIGHLLETDPLQFGYKRRHSTSDAIYAFKSCVDFFTSRGSSVFVAFLDCTKGFDRVNHDGMFLKLIKRKVPLCFLKLLIYWYSNLSSTVKWNNSLSDSFHVPSGVRQGGVLSPHLFVIYIDDLIIILRGLQHGCYLAQLFLACIVYADDICLLAPCRSALQLLLDNCESYGKSWCLSYNPAKCKVMTFGPQISSSKLQMYGKSLEVVNEYQYLGVNVVSGTYFSTSSTKPLIKFRSSANGILNVTSKSSEPVLMKLIFTICVPHLTYASEAISYTSRQLHPMNVALNDSIRRIYGYNRWESIRYLRLLSGYPSLTDAIHTRTRKFYRRISRSSNPILRALGSGV